MANIEIYCACLDDIGELHFFQKQGNAKNYLINNCGISEYEFIENDLHTEGDIVDSLTQDSLGYYYKVKVED